MNLIELARQAGADRIRGAWTFTDEELKGLAALIREECAKKCESFASAEYATGKVDHNEQAWTDYCAAAIRGMKDE